MADTPFTPKPAAPAVPVVPAKPVVPAVPAKPVVEEWPQPDGNPGDQEQLTKIHHALAAITDVGSLAGLLNVIASRCKTHRVHPDEIKKAFANTGVK